MNTISEARAARNTITNCKKTKTNVSGRNAKQRRYINKHEGVVFKIIQ